MFNPKRQKSLSTCLSGVILQAVLLRDIEVVGATLVLTDSDVPGPGGGRVSGVDVNGDCHTGWTDRHPHMLSGIVATDGRWGGKSRNTD